VIEQLSGVHEVVSFMEQTHLRLYENNTAENFPTHWHKPVEIIMPTEGWYEATIGNDTFRIQPYEILFVCPSVLHSIVAPDRGTRIIFQVDMSVVSEIYGLNSIISLLNPYAVFTPENAPAIHDELVKIILEIVKEYRQSSDLNNKPVHNPKESLTVSDNSMCELAIYALMIRMITLISRHRIQANQIDSHNLDKQQEYISKFMSICEYIDSHFSEDLSLEAIAAMSNFSKYHFSRLFKDFTNMSFYKYVNRKRISYAEQLLTNPKLSATEVAIMSGFSSQSAFIRMFRQFNNCTPTEFRKMLQLHEF